MHTMSSSAATAAAAVAAVRCPYLAANARFQNSCWLRLSLGSRHRTAIANNTAQILHRLPLDAFKRAILYSKIVDAGQLASRLSFPTADLARREAGGGVPARLH